MIKLLFGSSTESSGVKLKLRVQHAPASFSAGRVLGCTRHVPMTSVALGLGTDMNEALTADLHTFYN